MTVSTNYERLAQVGTLYVVDSFDPPGVYFASIRDDGSMDLIEKVDLVDQLRSEIEAARNELEMLRKSPSTVVPAATESKQTANKALAKALRDLNKEPNGPQWSRAKKLLAEGKSIAEAANLA
jgi:hypothetical protein